MVSFSLYLIHEPVLGVLHHTLHDLLPPAAICTISLAAAIPAAWLFYLGAELPVHRLARRIGRAQRPRRTTPARRWWAPGM
jgi:peptidoglycan/LPS O-acetylase OafA/YrhL